MIQSSSASARAERPLAGSLASAGEKVALIERSKKDMAAPASTWPASLQNHWKTVPDIRQ